ncbi:hypothetical protein O0L34_g10453 [Tuta absoluta]|nr:hypothetical protein O0L34_g10453 [Tuta absoluta]
MFSDDDIKFIPESLRSNDEILRIHEVCLNDKIDKKDLAFGEPSLCNSSKNYLDEPRSLFRDADSYFPEGLETQTSFAWTEEDGNIASLVSEPGFGTTGQTTFGKDLDAALKNEIKQEADTSTAVPDTVTSRNGLTFTRKPYIEPHLVSSTSSSSTGKRIPYKVDKSDPRSRFHFVKYVKRQDRTIKLWECGICSREFQHQYTLMRHLPTHTDERNFHCDECGKSFRQLSTLSQHRAIHSAERPYACEICNKTFNRVSTLISHRKTHSGEKPYKCHYCPKGFHQKGNLRNHLFTHTNERPYRCNICLRGFNQQSNLVCHKNKAHPEAGSPNIIPRSNTPRITHPPPKSKPDSIRSATADHCEVSSSVESYLPIDGPLPQRSNSIDWSIKSELTQPLSPDNWSGVIVDQIKTYHMEVALAMKQTPFALLKPENSAPVLVKVVDMHVPGGKQMLMPATAEDLRDGGKIVVKNEDGAADEQVDETITRDLAGAVQIRVPIVATVIPKIRPGGRLQLIVEEPHHAYHATLSSDLNVEHCSSIAKSVPPPPPPPPPPPTSPPMPCTSYDDDPLRGGNRISSTCTLPPPAPSPPCDLVHLDLFEPMIPLGPQITAVDNIDHPPPSDDSDIFIGEFEESIPLSDTD